MGPGSKVTDLHYGWNVSPAKEEERAEMCLLNLSTMNEIAGQLRHLSIGDLNPTASDFIDTKEYKNLTHFSLSSSLLDPNAYMFSPEILSITSLTSGSIRKISIYEPVLEHWEPMNDVSPERMIHTLIQMLKYPCFEKVKQIMLPIEFFHAIGHAPNDRDANEEADGLLELCELRGIHVEYVDITRTFG